MLLIGVTYLVGFLIVKPYAGIIRHTGLVDLERIILANLLSFFIGMLAYAVSFYYEPLLEMRIPLSIQIIHFLVLTFLMSITRFFIKAFYRAISRKYVRPKNILIYGATVEGMRIKSVIEGDSSLNFKVIGFIDEKPSKSGKFIDGLPIYASKKISKTLIENLGVELLLVSKQSIEPRQRTRVLNKFLSYDITIKNIPAVDQWINGEFNSNQLEDIRIEDLLERDPIRLDHHEVREQIKGKVVMVTGGAGSIGSEIARQILYYKPGALILVDKSESALHDLTIDLQREFSSPLDNVLTSSLCDIRNNSRIEQLFERYRPDVIYHAAAYKHVPMMEAHPYEAIKTNLLGTKNVLSLAIKYKANDFVLVSTDKAVNPTNVMGASKRMAEMYCHSFEGHSRLNIITTRFGNVLGSNGSVIPLFKKQIQQGGPLTVTHPEVTRYFMTIPEASELVLEAGAMGKGGEIFVFDMGNPIKVYDLAQKMLQICGKSEHDIPIEFVGLRPGEKLYEELLSNKEETGDTYHAKIRIVKAKSIPHITLRHKMDYLIDHVEDMSDIEIVRYMKTIVPEYKSNNSIFEKLDRETRSLVS
jgi:FlaA1/EpsC-like NDP-sugar epimerase